MKIFQLGNRMEKTGFATASDRCTWSPGTLCPVCKRTTEIQIEPLTLVWETGSDVIPDVLLGTWAAVQTPVRRFFEGADFHFFYGRVKHEQSKEPRRKQKIVEFPYRGPKFHWILPRLYVWPNLEQSEARLRMWCPRCASLYYDFPGNIVISAASWNGQKAFNVVYKAAEHIYLTEQAMEELLDQGFKGVTYKLAGEIR